MSGLSELPKMCDLRWSLAASVIIPLKIQISESSVEVFSFVTFCSMKLPEDVRSVALNSCDGTLLVEIVEFLLSVFLFEIFCLTSAKIG